jgi:hypothetical protein
MAIVRVQLKRRLSGSPSIGKWDVYSNWWFSTADPVLSSTEQGHLVDLACGKAPGSGGPFTRHDVFDSAAGASVLSTWEWTGSALTHLADYTPSIVRSTPSIVAVWPQQCSVAVGYRSDVSGPRQRGRSRWWIGPLYIVSPYAQNTVAGGPRLTTAGVDFLANNTAATLAALEALGWTLQVKTGQGLAQEFHPAVELYVDDVPDVMRTRRPWQTYQKRVAL